MTKIRSVSSILAVLIFFTVGAFAPSDAPSRPSEEPQPAGHGFFIQNVGQFRGGEYLLRGDSADFWISGSELRVSQSYLSVDENGKPVARQENFLLEFDGANPAPVVEPFGRLDTSLSYLIGSDPQNWHIRVPVWSGLRIRNLYDGIDLIMYGASAGGGLDWGLHARPGADLSTVKLKSTGIPAGVTAANGLQLFGALGTLSLDLPDGSVSGSEDTPRNGEINAADSMPETLSPSGGSLQAVRLINYMSFLGGSDVDKAYSVSAEGGYAYVTGYTRSTDFPLTAGVVDTTLEGADAFVAKVNPDGNGLIYATYLGGESTDIAYDIAVESGIAYITGSTDSTSFPGLTPWEYRDKEVFVVSLTADGSGIRYARRFGGTTDVEPDEGFGIAVEAGSAYITGLTYSADVNGTSTISKDDIFTIKINSTGVVQYITIHGQNGLDAAYDIAVSGGIAYITGQSNSKFFMGNIPAGFEGFVIKINAVGAIEWKTVLSGAETDRGNGIALDSSGNIYVVGATDSSDFADPLSLNLPYGGNDDGFIVRLTSAGTPNFRTFLGGSGIDRAFSLAVDGVGGVQVIGETYSSDFPVTSDALDSSLSGFSDGFVSRILPNELSILDYSSFIGGSDSDFGRGLALDIAGATFVCGETTSGDFQLSSTPFDPTFGGSGEGFIGKLTIGPVPGVVLKKYTNGADADLPPGPYVLVNDPISWRYDIFNTGSATLNQVTLTDDRLGTITCPSTTLAPGGSMICTATGTAVAGQYENLGTVVAQPPGELQPVTDDDFSHYFGANPQITITATTEGLDGRVILVGQTAEITYLVRNTGNVPLGSVVVTDTAGVPVSCQKTTLTSAEEMTCTSSILVTADTTSHTANVTASPPSGLSAISASDTTSHFGAAPSIVLTNKVSVDGGTIWNDSNTTPTSLTLLTGNAPKFQLSVYNSGNVALTNIAVTDSPLNCPTIASLAVGATSTPCVLTGTWESGERQNLISATGSYTDDLAHILPLSSSDSAYYFGANPTLSIQKEISLNGGSTWLDTTTGDAPALLSGTDPQYRITVQNTGNVALPTTISDPSLDFGTSCQTTILQPLGTQVCTATKTWAINQQTNTAHAAAAFTDSGGHSINIDMSDTAKYLGAAPALSFEKYVSINAGATWFEADDTTGPYLLSGHAAPQYKVTITNTGNVALTGVSVTDSVMTLTGCTTNFDLGLSAIKDCTASSLWSAGMHENTGSVNVTYTDSVGHTKLIQVSDKAHYFGAQPGLSVSNLVSINDGADWVEADTATGPTLLQGYNPRYKITVTNSGNVSLTVSLSGDPLSLPAECAPGTLAGGAAYVCEFSGAWGSGQQSNNALASAIYTDGASNAAPVNANNHAYYFGAQAQLDLEKYVSGDNGVTWHDADTQPGPYFLNSAVLKYKLVLDNTGNVTLSSLNWSDPAFNLTGCALPSTLTPEAAPVECILTGTWAAGQMDNLASAGGSFTDSAGHLASPSVSDAAHYFGAQPGVSITKSTNGEDADAAPGPYILVGDTVNWTYTITNTGNVPLTGITVTDDNGTPLNTSDDFTASCGSTQLAVSSQQTCTASGTAIEGQYANVGTVIAQPKVGELPIGLPLSASEVSHYFGTRITLTLEKTTNGVVDDNDPPGPFIEIGKNIFWKYTVTNTSNVTIEPVEVWDDMGTPSNPNDDQKVCTTPALGIGQSSDPEACKLLGKAVAGQYVNTGKAMLTMLGKNFTAFDLGHYYGYDPDNMLILTVSVNSQIPSPSSEIFLPAGESIYFSYSIFNSSRDFSVTNINLKDTSDDVTIPCSATELAPQTVTTCSRTISALAGSHTHNAEVTGLISGAQVSGNTTSSYFGTTPGITLDVHTNGVDPTSPLDLPVKAGSAVTWEYFIQNTSNIALTGISVVQNPEVEVDCPITELAISEAVTCTASGTAQSGAFTNHVTVKGVWPDDLQAFYDYEDSFYYGVEGAVALDFRVEGFAADEPPGPELPLDETANLTYKVTNTGNYPLIDILVSDDVGNSITCPKTALVENEFMICTAQETIEMGPHFRTAQVTGTVLGEVVSANDPVYYTGIQVEFSVFLPLILR